MSPKIVQIVPRLPPYTDGVGDYSLMLAKQLLQEYNLQTHFLICQANNYSEATIQGFPITVLPSRNTQAFLSLFPSDAQGIILQYSNYPYLQGKLDLPFWLPQALKSIIQQYPLQLVVMFHELPTLMWKQLRLLNPLQCRVSCYLANIAHHVVTNNSQFRHILSQWLNRKVDCIPNFATIGESKQKISLQERKNQIVIFGSSDRHRVYQNILPKLLETCEKLNISTIYDIGKPLNLQRRYNFGAINLLEMGFQPAQIISELLLNSRFGCLDYSRFPQNLAKSTVFAAFSAYGLIPLLTKNNHSQLDGLEVNKHYLVLDNQFNYSDWNQLQSVAQNAHQWYINHTLEKNTQVFASYFKKSI